MLCKAYAISSTNKKQFEEENYVQETLKYVSGDCNCVFACCMRKAGKHTTESEQRLETTTRISRLKK